MSHTVRLSPGDPRQFVPIHFPGDGPEAQLGAVSLPPTPSTQAAGTPTAPDGICDAITSRIKSLADTNVFKKVTQQAMTTSKSSWVNYVSPNGFESILHPN